MLAILLDEQISPVVAQELRRKAKYLTVFCMAEWHDGQFLGRPDEESLAAAAKENLTLVTYDRRTVPPILKAWAEEDKEHGGVVFIDNRTIAPSDFGALIHALQRLQKATGDWDWANRVYMLGRRD